MGLLYASHGPDEPDCWRGADLKMGLPGVWVSSWPLTLPQQWPAPELPVTQPGEQEMWAQLPPHAGLSLPAQVHDYSQPPAFAWWSHESHNT